MEEQSGNIRGGLSKYIFDVLDALIVSNATLKERIIVANWRLRITSCSIYT